MKLLTQWAVTSSVLILIVLVARYFLRDKLSVRWRYALWAVVLLRLLVPLQVELPANTSAALPVLASNLAPETAQWEEPSIPVFPEGSKPAAEFNFMIENVLEPGEIRPYQNGTGGQQRSIDGETITWYRYILSPEQIVLALWLVGAGLAGAVMLVSNLRFSHRLKKRRRRLEGVDAPIPVYAAEGLPSPCLFGVLRPAVYVTPEAVETPNTLRHVLAHELTHCAHFDHIWSLLRCLALALHWYNPLVWLAVVLSKGDGELACDEGAVARLGEEERIPYGRTLVDMVAARSSRPADLLSCSTAMTGGSRSIQRRVAQIVKKPETVKAALFAAVAVAALAAVFVFAGRAQPEVNTMFQDQLGLATSIHYGPPLYWSIVYPDPIADPELLAQAKEALSGCRYPGDDDTLPDLQEGLIHTSRMTLINNRTETAYTLLWQDGRTYLFPGDMWEEEMKLQEELGEGAHIQGVSGTMVSEPGVNLISILEGLAWQQKKQGGSGSSELDALLQDVGGASSIRYYPPSYSSQHYPEAITDPALLEQARELLSGLVPLEREDTVPDGEGMIRASRVLLTTGGGEVTYALIPWNNQTYVTRGSGDYFVRENGQTAFLRTGDETDLSDAIAALARRQESLPDGLTGLTRAQVEQINEAFRPDVELPDGSWGPSEISCFFTSSYDDPAKMDLEEFLRYCPLAEGVDEQADREEYRDVLEASFWADDVPDLDDFLLPTPMHRYPREKVSALLQKYAGVTVDQLNWGDMLYLEEYDAFYNFTSDYGPGVFHCEEGVASEDTARLWSGPDGNGGRCELVLRKSEGRWLIQSHHTTYER